MCVETLRQNPLNLLSSLLCVFGSFEIKWLKPGQSELVLCQAQRSQLTIEVIYELEGGYLLCEESETI